MLFFLQAHHPAVAEWIPEHKKQIANSGQAEVVLLDANHYLYRSHPQEIAERVRKFMQGIQ